MALQRVFGYESKVYSVSTDRLGNDLRVVVDDVEHGYTIDEESSGHVDLRDASGRERGYAVRSRNEIWVQWRGQVFVLTLEARAPRSGSLAPARDEIHAPMTGTVRRVHVAVGDQVAPGQPLVVLEAMKMEHVLRAPRAGRIAALEAREGLQAEAHDLLVRLAPADEA